MTPERLAEIREQVADYHCQECALDVELLAYVDGLRRERAELRAEVERLADKASHMTASWRTDGRREALSDVLVLIDKREGE